MTKVVTARGVIRSFVERVERLEAEKKALGEDISEVFKEAKGVGLDVPALRRQIKRRKIDRAKLQEMDALDELYSDALSDTPLGQAALARETSQAA